MVEGVRRHPSWPLHGYGFGYGAFAPTSRRLGGLGVPASGTQLRQALDTVGGLLSM